MAMDIANGYQEAGANYLYALLTGYKDPPQGFVMSEGMSYNAAFPGHQIAMVAPLVDGSVKYQNAAVPMTVSQYSKDVTAFLTWAADPRFEERKSMGWLVMLYLLVTSVLLYFAKKRLWSSLH
jgi:cytochrome c1